MRLPRPILVAILALLVAAVSAAAWIDAGGWDGIRHCAFAESIKAHLEPWSRDRWQMPDQVIAALHLRRAETVADIGAGHGYFARRFARALAQPGRRGWVYAVEIDKSAFEYLQGDAKRLGLKDYKPWPGSAEGPNLPAHSVTLIFMCDTYHHIRNPNYLRSAGKALAPGGRFAIIDFKKDPEIEAEEKYEGRISREQVLDDFHAAGYTLEQEFHFLPKQYFMVFSAPGARQVVK